MECTRRNNQINKIWIEWESRRIIRRLAKRLTHQKVQAKDRLFHTMNKLNLQISLQEEIDKTKRRMTTRSKENEKAEEAIIDEIDNDEAECCSEDGNGGASCCS